MANLDFYAAADDLRELFRFLFGETNIVVYESSSERNLPVRQFRSLPALEEVIALGNYRAAYLQLWSPSVMVEPVIRRIDMAGLPQSPQRYSVEGAGLMQLYLSGIQEGVIHHTHFGHWSEAGARQRSIHPASDCNWRELSNLSGQVQRHIRNKMACAKLHARPVLRHAYTSVQEGAALWFGPEVHGATSASIVPSSAA
jgi:hypothetical protein